MTNEKSQSGDSAAEVPAGELIYHQEGPLAFLTFNRPHVRNAITWAMYDALYQACERVDADDSVRVLLLQGAGEKAFIAGTDISQFTAFQTPEDGLAYEARIDSIIGRLEALRKPAIALLRGYAVGAGASIALTCDLRLATPSVQFGIPVARTLGNCLSLSTYARLVDTIGPARTKELLFTARLVGPDEGQAAGLFNDIVPDNALEQRGRELAMQIAGHAPLTLWATKESLRRLREQRLAGVDTSDVVARVYTSEDFHEGVSAFLEKRKPAWQGR